MRAARAVRAACLGLGISVVAGMGAVATASADTTSGPDYGAVVKGETVSQAPLAAAPTGVAAVQVSPEQSSGPLPLTGSDVAELSGFGLALVGAGTIMVRRTRRKA
jgi:LPXTG-motif cell wall-anchored protein